MRSDAVSPALDRDVTERVFDVCDFNDVGHDHGVTIEHDLVANSARTWNWQTDRVYSDPIDTGEVTATADEEDD